MNETAYHCSKANRADTSAQTDISFMKGGIITTMTTDITGKESARDLMELRRIDKRNRLHKRVDQLFGDKMKDRSETESTDDNIAHAILFPIST